MSHKTGTNILKMSGAHSMDAVISPLRLYLLLNAMHSGKTKY